MEESSIIKLLDEDVDESNYSGADVDALTAALNRDMEGGNASISQTTDSDTGNPISNELLGQWQTSSQEESLTCQKEERYHLEPQEQHSSEVELIQHGSDGSGSESQHQQNGRSLEHQQTEQNAHQFSGKNHVQISEQDRFQQSESQLQNSKLPPLNNRPVPALDQANNPMRPRNKPNPFISFGMLIPNLLPLLDKDKQMQLHSVFAQLRRNEVSKEDFLRIVRSIVGDHMLRQTAQKLHATNQAKAARTSQTGQPQYQLQPQGSSQQLTMSPSSTHQFKDAQFFSQHHSISSNQYQKGHGSPTNLSQIPAPTPENTAPKSTETERLSDAQGPHVSQISSTSMNTNQERELSMLRSIPQTSFPMYASPVSNYNSHPYSGPSVSAPTPSLKAQSQDSQMRQVPHLQGMGSSSTQLGVMQSTNLMNVGKVQNAVNEPKRLPGGSLSHMSSHSALQQNPIAWQPSLSKDQTSGLSPMVYPKQELVDQTSDQQHKPQMSASQRSSSFGGLHNGQGNPTVGHLMDETIEKHSARLGFPTSTSLVSTNQNSGSGSTQLDSAMLMRSQMSSAATQGGLGTNARTPPKKPSVGQKKPLETLGTPPLPSKKQKISGGALLDQSIEQLNDVTAVSGVNLREEEEQLFSAPKEDNRASEATRRVVQEEEERLILQKGPLHKKIAEIMSKCGIKSTGSDVERCLSMCVEERMRGLISNLIRLSKQRVNIEKPRHRVVITSDVRRQILITNSKAKEDWEKKQAEEAEKLRKLNEAEGNTGIDVDKDKDDGRLKALKANKEEDDKMRTTAANVAARAAVGGDDMLSKWQLMAEQARQKREGGMDGTSGAPPGKDPIQRSLSSSLKTIRDNQEGENRGPSAADSAIGAIRKFGKNAVAMPQTKVARSVSVKDVIAVLEREPQMSKSTLLYRLYDRISSNATAE
ncbi:TBP-associated factor 4 [Tasmannia lanceolata]|uniref:TBP-associated factor 4 n=1 Tax=Tasmannia lanceolata TaxID=3420 RepID=UPI00406463D0